MLRGLICHLHGCKLWLLPALYKRLNFRIVRRTMTYVKTEKTLFNNSLPCDTFTDLQCDDLFFHSWSKGGKHINSWCWPMKFQCNLWRQSSCRVGSFEYIDTLFDSTLCKQAWRTLKWYCVINVRCALSLHAERKRLKGLGLVNIQKYISRLATLVQTKHDTCADATII